MYYYIEYSDRLRATVAPPELKKLVPPGTSESHLPPRRDLGVKNKLCGGVFHGTFL
jgi:hypothetical protein